MSIEFFTGFEHRQQSGFFGTLLPPFYLSVPQWSRDAVVDGQGGGRWAFRSVQLDRLNSLGVPDTTELEFISHFAVKFAGLGPGVGPVDIGMVWTFVVDTACYFAGITVTTAGITGVFIGEASSASGPYNFVARHTFPTPRTDFVWVGFKFGADSIVPSAIPGTNSWDGNRFGAAWVDNALVIPNTLFAVQTSPPLFMFHRRTLSHIETSFKEQTTLIIDNYMGLDSAGPPPFNDFLPVGRGIVGHQAIADVTGFNEFDRFSGPPGPDKNYQYVDDGFRTEPPITQEQLTVSGVAIRDQMFDIAQQPNAAATIDAVVLHYAHQPLGGFIRGAAASIHDFLLQVPGEPLATVPVLEDLFGSPTHPQVESSVVLLTTPGGSPWTVQNFNEMCAGMRLAAGPVSPTDDVFIESFVVEALGTGLQIPVLNDPEIDADDKLPIGSATPFVDPLLECFGPEDIVHPVSWPSSVVDASGFVKDATASHPWDL